MQNIYEYYQALNEDMFYVFRHLFDFSDNMLKKTIRDTPFLVSHITTCTTTFMFTTPD